MNLGSSQLKTILIFEDGVLLQEEAGNGWGY